MGICPPQQARHLTVHGVNQNEDGTYSWKFDNYVRSWPPYDMRSRTSRPSGVASAARPCWSTAKRAGPLIRAEDGRVGAFKNAQRGDDRKGRTLGAPRPAR